MVKKVFIFLLIILAFGALSLAVTRFFMDYNEQGLYFDGEVVYKEDAVLVYGLLGILWLISAVIFMRWRKKD